MINSNEPYISIPISQRDIRPEHDVSVAITLTKFRMNPGDNHIDSCHNRSPNLSLKSRYDCVAFCGI